MKLLGREVGRYFIRKKSGAGVGVGWVGGRSGEGGVGRGKGEGGGGGRKYILFGFHRSSSFSTRCMTQYPPMWITF